MQDWNQWLTLLANYGIGGVVVLFVGWCIRAIILYAGRQFDTYVPPAIQAHITLMSTLTETQRQLSENQKQLAESTEKLTDSFIGQQKELGHCRSTSNALVGLCETFEHAATGHPQETRIKASLSNVKTILTSAK